MITIWAHTWAYSIQARTTAVLSKWPWHRRQAFSTVVQTWDGPACRGHCSSTRELICVPAVAVRRWCLKIWNQPKLNTGRKNDNNNRKTTSRSGETGNIHLLQPSRRREPDCFQNTMEPLVIAQSLLQQTPIYAFNNTHKEFLLHGLEHSFTPIP